MKQTNERTKKKKKRKKSSHTPIETSSSYRIRFDVNTRAADTDVVSRCPVTWELFFAQDSSVSLVR